MQRVPSFANGMSLNFFPFSSPVGLPKEGWGSPKDGITELNFDVVLNLTAYLAGMGGITRNRSNGEVIAAFTGAIKATHPLEAELQPLLKGVLIAQTMKIRPVMIDGDFLILVENLQRICNLS